MKKSILISCCSSLLLCFPMGTYAQNYIEGEVIVIYKNAESQTITEGTQLLLPQKKQIATKSILTPYAAALPIPCETSPTSSQPETPPPAEQPEEE
jgi:hypothetical protein